ncbi:hypothetical protein MHU86_20724 [Fragilaria crotonensis]|nr:hypothetical protein MHU86_20724 [Fragilaria crotonensis]
MRLRNEGAAVGVGANVNPNGMQMSNMNLNVNGGNVNGGMMNGHTASIQDMLAAMNANGLDTSGFNAAMAHGSSYSATTDDPLSLQQMSQDPQRWDQASFTSDLRTMPPPNHVFSNVPMSTLDQLSLATDFANITPDPVESTATMSMQNFNNGGGGIVSREPELTLEEYMESMQGFNHTAGADQLDLQRTNELLSMHSNSWIKSFHSLENSSKNDEMTLDDSNGSFGVELQKELDKSLRKELKQEEQAKKGDKAGKKEKRQHNKLDFNSIDKSSSLHKQTSTRTHLSAATQKSAMSLMSTKSAQSGMSGLSMLSGMSETTRGSKMSANRNQASSLSMMSDFTELTDVSETLANLDLHA